MASYRLYVLGQDGRIDYGSDIEALEDGEAIELARLRLEHTDIEIWCGTRKVALVPKDGLAVTPSRPACASPAS